LNGRAWFLVVHADGSQRAADLAVTMARRAVSRSANAAHVVNTLGVAYYRAGDWNAAIETLERADALGGGRSFGYNAYFIAMAHWRLGNRELARKWYAAA